MECMHEFNKFSDLAYLQAKTSIEIKHTLTLDNVCSS